mmetsp:Transcript_24835/g.71233  ORF Transcript_24835/g.71233 Transcript_24835/m.71233 type:complete len:434 (-) Transcript_24835:20-1321(-)
MTAETIPTTGSCSDDSIAVEEKVGRYPQSKLLEEARKIVEDRTKDWQIISPAAEERIPRFYRDEIELANLLGKGGFFEVHEIKSITLKHDDLDSEGEEDMMESMPSHRWDNPEDEEDHLAGVVQNRRFMAKHCIRRGKDPRYAFKIMQDINRTDPETFLNSVVDMAIEFKFLSAVRHPNILKMRAVSVGDIFQPKAFLVLDRIYDTLTERIEKWKKKDQNSFKFFDFQKRKEKALLAKRLLVAYDIASALAYLHDINVMYRDLKPSNVGFDVRNDAKLFDFGLATEFRPEEVEKGDYKLTGDTGTIRYMAPEVALSQPYTEKADVYSYGILLWEIMEMGMPYGKLTEDMIERKVIHLGFRPKIDPQWPPAIRRLLQDCFASSPRRPSMDVVSDVLKHEIRQLSDKDLLDDEDAMDFVDSARSAMSARYIGTYK